MAVRITVRDKHRREVKMLLISAYAPVGRAPQAERSAFLDNLQRAIDSCKEREVMIISIDANASMGKGTEELGNQVLGKFGVDHSNGPGEQLYQLLAANEICSTTSFFQSGRSSGGGYATWYHPRSKKGHQLDYMLVKRRDLRRICDAKRTRKTCDSDHSGIRLTIRIAHHMHASKVGKPKKRINLHFLRSEKGQKLFVEALRENVEEWKQEARATFYEERESIELDDDEEKDLAEALQMKYSELIEHLENAGKATLMKEVKKKPGWWTRKAEEMRMATAERDKAWRDKVENNIEVTRQRLKLARQKVKRAVAKAKEEWLEIHIDKMNREKNANGATDQTAIWKAIKEIKAGYSTFSKSLMVMMYKNGISGEQCKTELENAKVYANHFEKVLNIDNTFDLMVLELIKQREEHTSAGEIPTTSEVKAALKRMKNGKASGDSIPVEFLKAMTSDPEIFQLLMDVILHFWTSGEIPEEFRFLRLKVLPKKGDLRAVGKWRGIFLMDTACKLISKIVTTRLVNILKIIGIEEQNGFMRGRGTTDGIFTLMQALRKRQEHSLDTWVAYIDLVKAFPSVPRNGLMLVLAKMGVPAALVEVIQRLHENIIAKFKLGKEEMEIPNTSGTKQGDPLAAILFLFFIQACMETLNLKALEYRTGAEAKQMEFGVAGVRPNVKRGVVSFNIGYSLYADDAGVLFESREELSEGLRHIHEHFHRFGLTMHVGRDGSKSKTECMYYAGKGNHIDVDLSDIIVTNDGGYVTFCDRFPYLGSRFTTSLRAGEDVKYRIQKAAGAFGALKCIFKDRKISVKAKTKVYMALILGVLLYGGESWALLKRDQDNMERFHRRCMRTICNMSRRKQWKQHITSKELEQALNMQSLEHYLQVRVLRWAGHVVRMDYSRMPRKLLFGWVNNKRPRGRTLLTFGHRVKRVVKKALDKAHHKIQREVRETSWIQLAKQRGKWLCLVHAGSAKADKHIRRCAAAAAAAGEE